MSVHADRSDNAKYVFEQYWLHARHQEIQLLTFTGIYSAIVAGAFAYMGSEFSDMQSRALLSIALGMVSFLGFFLTYNFNFAYMKFSRLAEKIKLEILELGQYKAIDGGTKKVSGYTLMYTFFGLMASLFTAIAIWTLTEAASIFPISDFSFRRELVSLALCITALILAITWRIPIKRSLNALKKEIPIGPQKVN